jgi:hypothetical protein
MLLTERPSCLIEGSVQSHVLSMRVACYDDPVSNVQVKNLDPEIHDQLRERAMAAGLTISDYVLGLIRRDLQLPSRGQWLKTIASLPRHDFSRDDVTGVLHDERAKR